MNSPGDIEKRNTEIEELVGDGEHRQSFRRLIDFANDFSPGTKLRDEAIVISGEFNCALVEYRQELISYEDFNRLRRRLTFALLDVKNQIVDATVKGSLS